MKRFLSVILAVMMILTVTGCKKGKNVPADLEADVMIEKQPVSTKEFVLDKTYVTADGNNAEIKGSVAVPESSENVPVVFVLGDGENSYFAEEIASYGMVAVDVVTDGRTDEDCAKMVANIILAIKDNDVVLGDGISTKADVERLAFAGVGFAGGQALSVGETYGELTKGIYVVEPYLSQLVEYPDTNIGVVLHENDTQSNGQEIFEALRCNKERKSFASYAYMYDADNTEDEKQAFIARYGADFMNAAFMLQDNPALVMLSTYNTGETLYGIKTKTAFSGAEKTVIADEIIPLHPRAAIVGVKNVSVTAEINNASGFRLPGMVMDLALMQCRWDNEGVEVILDDTDKSPRLAIYTQNVSTSDFSPYKYLTVYLAPNPADTEYFRSEKEPRYSLRIVDNRNLTQTVEIDPKLSVYLYGEGEHDKQSNLWSTPTPMGTIAVPLAMFDEIDLTNVKMLSLVVEEVETGSLMIGDVSLVKAMDK